MTTGAGWPFFLASTRSCLDYRPFCVVLDQLEEIFPADSVYLIHHNHPAQNMFAGLADRVRQIERRVDKFLVQLDLAGGFPGKPSQQNFIKNDASRPNITFGSVRFLSQNLRSHIQRGTHYRLQHGCIVLRHMPCHTEICQLELIHVFDQNVRRFKIPMCKTVLVEAIQT